MLRKLGSQKRGPQCPLARPAEPTTDERAGWQLLSCPARPAYNCVPLPPRTTALALTSPAQLETKAMRNEYSYNMLERSLSSTVPPPQAVYSWLRFRAVRWYGRRTHSTSASVCSIVPCRISYAENSLKRRSVSTS